LGGLLGCLALAERFAHPGARFAVGHAFEGPVGLTACAALALALQARGLPTLAAGIDRHVGLSAWPPVELPFAPGDELRPWRAPGLGFTVAPA
ncbi:MAG TPA: hypothetical protein VMB50_02850, partial [Myxococcales bacterium]|nr:hypothetical protein [Myxococcales bacterium]